MSPVGRAITADVAEGCADERVFGGDEEGRVADFSEFGGDEIGVLMLACIMNIDGGGWILRCWTMILSDESSAFVARDQVDRNPFVPVYVAIS